MILSDTRILTFLEKHAEVLIVEEFIKRVQKLKTDFKGSACHLALLLAPEMLRVLDPPTFRGSHRYEVPTRNHTVWSRSPNSGW